MFNKIHRQIYKEIKKYNTIVIARHIGPDPDALGAQIGLRDIISHTFPNKKVYAVGTPAARFKYIGKLDKMSEELYKDALLIVVDTPDKKRVDSVDPSRFKSLIKIDHHPEIETFCHIEWTDPLSSSVCQMIVELCFNTKLKLTKYAAERLFIGIIADTDRFLYDYTTVKTFDLTKKLIASTNIDIIAIYNELYMRPLSEIRLQGYIATNMIITEHGVGYIVLTDDIIKEYGVDPASAGNLVNSFGYIEGVYIWLTISEDKKQETIRINIRSRGPIINIIAEKYNGGGHKYASGARVATLEETMELVAELNELSKIYKKENNIE